MVEFCYQDKIDDYFVPNGIPPFILDKMKKMENPSGIFDNGGFQNDVKLEIGVSTFKHIKALLEHSDIKYRECLVSERTTEDYLLPIALFGSANGVIGVSDGQIICEFTKTFSSQTLEDIKNKKCKVVLDGVNEGLPYNKEWCKKIHEVIDSSDLPRSSFYFFTGNNIFKRNYEKDFNGELINVVECTFFETYTKDYCIENILHKEIFSPQKRNKHFLSLNRSPRLHRSNLFNYLKLNKLLKYGYVSYVAENYFVDDELTIDAKDNKADSFIERNFFEDSYFNIVTETWFYEKSLYLTEKIFKPIIYFQPFLVFGSVYSLKHLRELGYKTFNKIFDESYDEEEDNDKRFEMICNEINRICKLPLSDIHEMYLSVRDILEYNYKHFLIKKQIDYDVFGR